MSCGKPFHEATVTAGGHGASKADVVASGGGGKGGEIKRRDAIGRLRCVNPSCLVKPNVKPDQPCRHCGGTAHYTNEVQLEQATVAVNKLQGLSDEPLEINVYASKDGKRIGGYIGNEAHGEKWWIEGEPSKKQGEEGEYRWKYTRDSDDWEQNDEDDLLDRYDEDGNEDMDGGYDQYGEFITASDLERSSPKEPDDSKQFISSLPLMIETMSKEMTGVRSPNRTDLFARQEKVRDTANTAYMDFHARDQRLQGFLRPLSDLLKKDDVSDKELIDLGYKTRSQAEMAQQIFEKQQSIIWMGSRNLKDVVRASENFSHTPLKSHVQLDEHANNSQAVYRLMEQRLTEASEAIVGFQESGSSKVYGSIDDALLAESLYSDNLDIIGSHIKTVHRLRAENEGREYDDKEFEVEPQVPLEGSVDDSESVTTNTLSQWMGISPKLKDFVDTYEPIDGRGAWRMRLKKSLNQMVRENSVHTAKTLDELHEMEEGGLSSDFRTLDYFVFLHSPQEDDTKHDQRTWFLDLQSTLDDVGGMIKQQAKTG